MLEGFALLNTALIALTIWAQVTTRRFLRAYPAISSQAALGAFKALARRNMYAALVYISGAFVSVLWGSHLIKTLGLPGFLTAMAFYVPGLFVAIAGMKVEKQARTLSSDPQFSAEYARISQVWVKKALPDF